MLFKYLRAAVQIFIIFSLLGLSTVFIVPLVILSLGTLRNLIIQYYGLFIGRVILRTLNVPLHVNYVGTPLSQPAVYIANHSSTLDMFVIIALGLKKIRYVAKYEILYNPFFAFLGLVTGQIFIKRQDTQKAIASLNRSLAFLKRKNLSLFVSPEGTRKHTEPVAPFKKGAFRMAMQLKYPIVPVFIEGARQSCSGDSLIVDPGKITAYIHDPIDTEMWTLENLDEHISAIRQQYIQWEHNSLK